MLDSAVTLPMFLLCLKRYGADVKSKPLGPCLVLVEVHGKVCCTFSQKLSAKTLWLHNLLACPQRKGHGTIAMDLFCAAADHAGVVLKLTVAPYGSDPMSRRNLTIWYHRFGFKGSYGTLVRSPRGRCKEVEL